MQWRPADPPAYAHLLGLYLGDGCVSTRRTGGTDLRIKLDAAYPEIIRGCARSIRLVAPARTPTVRASRHERSVEVASGGSEWLAAFPQHGPGRKHERRIELADWQRVIVEDHPWLFLRGLLESDGCRTENRVCARTAAGASKEYRYARWFFSNRSEDILGLFAETCDRVGVVCTRSNSRNLSVSRRSSVRLLDLHVGPKC